MVVVIRVVGEQIDIALINYKFFLCHDVFFANLNGLNQSIGVGGGHISLEARKSMEIGGVLAPVILAMVDLNFV